MGVASIICKYIYSSFLLIQKGLKSAQKIAKDALNKIYKYVMAIKNIARDTISSAVESIKKAITSLTKSLADFIFNPDKIPLLCGDLFKCLALLKELLDDDSLFTRTLKKHLRHACNGDTILDKLSDLIGDFDKFREVVCNFGFSFDFAISGMTLSLTSFKKMILKWDKFLTEKIQMIRNKLQNYIDLCIDQGIIDYLDKLKAFFECVLDATIDDCTEIATASNLYQSVLAKLHLEEKGDGYAIEESYMNSIIGPFEGLKEELVDLNKEIDKIEEICVNPIELKVATKAFDVSKNIFPGGMSWNDIKSGNWKKNRTYQYVSQKIDDIKSVYVKKTGNTDVTTSELVKGTQITSSGRVYVKDKCDFVDITDDLPAIDPPVENEFMMNGDGSEDAIVDDGELISVTEAGRRIQEDPDCLLAKRCQKIWSIVEGTYEPQELLQRY